VEEANRRAEELEAEQQRMALQLATERAQREQERAEREAERVEQKRFAEILAFLHNVGAQTGVAVPPGLMAPPTPRPQAAATPVSNETHASYSD
jgi:hypothetical protein